MKKLFTYADEYIKESDWQDLAMLKLCLGALGVLIGLSLPGEKKKTAGLFAAGIFTATYLPLMSKFYRIITRENKKA